MRIRSDRLLLRPFEPGDVDDVWAYQRLPELNRHMLRETRDRDGAESFVRAVMTRTALARDGDEIVFAVVLPEGAVIGELALVLRSVEHRAGEIGYVLHPEHHGRGLATEAADELLRLGFGEFGMHRITAKCSALNTASARLMERLGMRREGHLLGVRRFDGRWRDEFVYAILADEWRLRSSR